MSTESDIVVFLDSHGNEFSNDPRWLARQTLQSYGVEKKEAEDFEVGGDYDDLTGKELKALARERGIKTTGLTRASQYREALEAWDAENSSTTENDESIDDDESSDSGNPEE